MVTAEAGRLFSQGEVRTDQPQEQQLLHEKSDKDNTKVPRLSVKYKSLRLQLGNEEETARAQLERCLPQEQHLQDAVMFWRPAGQARLKYSALYLVAQLVFLVPARSAPVERVFTKGGDQTEITPCQTLTISVGNSQVLEM